MTGIESLRRLARSYEICSRAKKTVEIDVMCVSHRLSKIADKIEREQAEVAADHAIVASVASEMERHALGHEGMEDSPVTRWARELRQALGGRDDAKDVSMSAYDLLPEEDRKAIAWVRKHGGLESMRSMFRNADSRRVELCEALGIDLDKGWSEAMAAMRLRLMPEGMEWPRFEDGKPVRFSDEVELFSRHGVVNGVELMSATFVLKDTRDGTILQAAHGERVRRPAPEDSWERLEEDATKNPFDYCKDVGHRLDTCENSEAYKARDIVRRARALAERG